MFRRHWQLKTWDYSSSEDRWFWTLKGARKAAMRTLMEHPGKRHYIAHSSWGVSLLKWPVKDD